MTTVRRLLAAPVRDVWETLADGWLYPLFVVGASRMRDVDDTWPAAGARLHHSVGAWPLLLDDTTEVLASVPRVSLRLEAAARPAGRAEVLFELRREGTRATEVVLSEDAVSGPARLVPRPARAPGIVWRNTETLRRLSYVVERRTARHG